MIDQKYSIKADGFEDAIAATVFMATVHILHGELTLPDRVRTHVADGPVVVHLLRGEDEDDFARIEATLTGASKLTGIEWPDDIKPHMSLTVLCPRGAAGHDIAVLLPPLPEPLHYEYAEDREAVPGADIDPIELVETSQDDGLCSKCPAPAIDDPYFTERYCQQHLTEAYDADADAEYNGPTDDGSWQRDELDFEDELLDDNAPSWPGEEELAPQEVTDLLPVVVPEIVHRAEPGTVYSAALVAAKTRRRWFSPLVDAVATTVRLKARWELEHSRTVARLILGTLSLTVLAGVGVLAALGVTR